MLNTLKKAVNKIFPDFNTSTINRLLKKVDLINTKEIEFQSLKDDEIKTKTEQFKQRLEKGETLAGIMIEALALAKNGCRRLSNGKHTYKKEGEETTWNMIPYDVQLIGAMILHEGNIAEMKTGEGKTLVAALALYLHSLEGKGCHLVTVNDYLAERDANEMGQLYSLLGVSVGVIRHGLSPDQKRENYGKDITYGTNNEFGFDYLRDNMATKVENMTQRPLNFAIVDEVDSILIDEARTPLIISSPAEESTSKYIEYSRLVGNLKDGDHYAIDEKQKTAILTEDGVREMEKLIGVKNIYTEKGFTEVHHIEQALKAHYIFVRDKDYMVRDGRVVIVDEFTGRLMEGRRFGNGLHQALEAKEGVNIQRESKTLATITFQNYFRLYDHLAGMTGTALTEAEEFATIYGLETFAVPTNKPMARIDNSDSIYKSDRGKYAAMVKKVKELNQKGQPVLVGTVSVEKSEVLSSEFKNAGISHTVLNAKYHEKEAEIIAKAGQPGAVTIATNMAGRGTDIKLGTGVAEVGGLFILGSERHESRRIDNQLRGRGGRQGDAGESQFFISMDDDLMKRFGSEKMKSIMEAMGLPDDMPIENKMISRSIEGAQKKVEQYHFDIRKHVVQYDDVMNKHREIIYERRKEILNSDDISERIQSELKKYIHGSIVPAITGIPVHEWDYKEMYSSIKAIQSEGIFEYDKWHKEGISEEKLLEMAETYLKGKYEEKEKNLPDPKILRQMEKAVYLQTIDMLWMEHINELNSIREAVALSGYGQRDPLLEYKHQAFEALKKLLDNISRNTLSTLFKAKVEINITTPQVIGKTPMKTNEAETEGQITKNQMSSDINEIRKIEADKAIKKAEAEQFAKLFQAPQKVGIESKGGITTIKADDQNIPKTEKIGRNDPCPCGSGKKYKKCCGS